MLEMQPGEMPGHVYRFIGGQRKEKQEQMNILPVNEAAIFLPSPQLDGGG